MIMNNKEKLRNAGLRPTKQRMIIANILLNGVNRHLNKNGVFAIEFGKGQDFLLKEELLRSNFKKACFYKDLNNVNRVACVKKDT